MLSDFTKMLNVPLDEDKTEKREMYKFDRNLCKVEFEKNPTLKKKNHLSIT